MIFVGNITRWNDPRILAVNGNNLAPFATDADHEIIPVVRNDSSGKPN